MWSCVCVMTISSVSIVAVDGKILATRDYRGEVHRSELKDFVAAIIKGKNAADTPPVLCHAGTSFAFVRDGSVFVVASTRWDANAVAMIEFLNATLAVLKSYFGGVAIKPSDVREKLPLVYALLDELMDFGYPQIMTPEVLKAYILEKGLPEDRRALAAMRDKQKQVTLDATGAVSWRKQGITYKKNELYLDALEKCSALLNPSGEVLYAEVNGVVKMKAQLSGMPECKIGLNDKLQMEATPSGPAVARKPTATQSALAAGSRPSVTLDSLKFHQCVRLGNYEANREIWFVPPDGEFELMTYRMSENVHLPFKVSPVVTVYGRTRCELQVRIRSEFPAELTAYKTELHVPLPKNAAGADIKVSGGRARSDLGKSEILWIINEFEGGGREFTMNADVKMVQLMHDKPWDKPPIKLGFQIPMFTASGFRVRFLKVQEKSNYVPTKWVRYVSTAGDYEVRM